MDDWMVRLSNDIDADDAAARACSESASHFSPDWRAGQFPDGTAIVVDTFNAQVAVGVGKCAPHIARHNPARALRQTAAIEEIQCWHRLALADEKAQMATAPHLRKEPPLESVTLGVVLRILADIYPEEKT